jgi:formylglycine-generating enzyme required for sulfatase activity
VPDTVDLRRSDAVVYLQDIYAGRGLEGIPRGTVKKLRLVSFHFLYPNMGGPQGVVGMEGPWDIKRIVGTVPVEADGSATFRIPANTPIAVQPLDAEGKALQLMRSWFTAMPGEVVSCVGCHEGQNSSPPTKSALAMRRPPAEIVPWHGPERGFNFAREVQPVLDKFCVGCHNGQAPKDGPAIADLRGVRMINDYTSVFHHGGVDGGHFSTSYAELHRYVRRPGMESDLHMLVPMEYHADTTQLVQLLAKGHHGIRLDGEAWDRLITWIDLNAPYHGTWTEIAGEARVKPLAQRRRELLRLYAGMDRDPEAIPAIPRAPVEAIVPPPEAKAAATSPPCPGWPFDAAEAKRRQAVVPSSARSVDLGGGIAMELVYVPSGRFVMGDADGDANERPLAAVAIGRAFWMGRVEVTNEQFARFDAEHDSRVESKNAMQFGVRGFYVNGPKQPVVRVSWERAAAFCDWLSRQTGRRFALPTEAQWEYACRAGTNTAFSFGPLETDFSPYANLADLMLAEFVCHPYKKQRDPFPNPGKYDDWIPKDTRFRDGGFVTEPVGRWRPNAWGLCDMHGNAAEWTRSSWRPYPYREDDGRNEPTAEPKVVRGGSWRDRPREARSAARLAYRPYQPVFNVGFRVICEE